MPHFCWDEMVMIMAGLPFVGFGVQWLRSKLGRKKAVKKAVKCCDHPHRHKLPEAKVIKHAKI